MEPMVDATSLGLTPLLRCLACQTLLQVAQLAADRPEKCPACHRPIANAGRIYAVLQAIMMHLERRQPAS